LAFPGEIRVFTDFSAVACFEMYFNAEAVPTAAFGAGGGQYFSDIGLGGGKCD